MLATNGRLIGSAVAALVLSAVSGCANDGRTLSAPNNTTVIAAAAAATTATAPPNAPPVAPPNAPTVAPATAAPATAASNVTIDLLRSPENATVEATGNGATYSDAVTVDGLPADVISFDIAADGSFVMLAWVEEEGAHTVCVGAACGRVYTLEPDAESPEEVIALIEQAIPLAQQLIDYPTLFPEWAVEIGGLLSGTGGSTDADRQVVTIYRNRNRTVDDFVRTIVHEMGHVADAEWLDDDDRAAYLALRGVPADTPWRADGSTGGSTGQRLEDWQMQPSEDFAEVMAMIWSDGVYVPRTDTLAPAPDADQLAAVEALVSQRERLVSDTNRSHG